MAWGVEGPLARRDPVRGSVDNGLARPRTQVRPVVDVAPSDCMRLQRSWDSNSERDAESAQGWSPPGVEVVDVEPRFASQCTNGGECVVHPRQGQQLTSYPIPKTSHCRHPEGHSW